MAGLLDFMQAMSNSAASNVSAPVDGLAWLLRKAGVPIPDAPLGGSDWMESAGLTRPVEGTAGLLGETVGGLAPILAAAKAPQIARGMLKAGENLAAPSRLGRQAGVAYVPLSDEVAAARGLAQNRVIDFGDGRTVTVSPARSAYGDPRLNADLQFSNTATNSRSTYPAGSQFQQSSVSNYLRSPEEIAKVRAVRGEVSDAKNSLYEYIQAQNSLISDASNATPIPKFAEILTAPMNDSAAGAEWWNKAIKSKSTKSLQAFAEAAKDSRLMKFPSASVDSAADTIASKYGISAAPTQGGLLFSGENGALQVYDAASKSPYIRSIAAGSAGKESGGGNKLYQAAMNWAANNGKVFAPDPAGITPINELRKLGNELSSQIRNGKPTAVMNSPGMSGIGGIADVWGAESALVKKRMPKLDVTFDGSSFSMKDAEIVKAISNKDPSFSKGVGLMTAKRTAIEEWIRSGNVGPDAAKAAALGLIAAGSGPLFARD